MQVKKEVAIPSLYRLHTDLYSRKRKSQSLPVVAAQISKEVSQSFEKEVDSRRRHIYLEATKLGCQARSYPSRPGVPNLIQLALALTGNLKQSGKGRIFFPVCKDPTIYCRCTLCSQCR